MHLHKAKEATLQVLTPREREICTLVAYGYTNREIGRALEISERTVETHRANLTSKLGLKKRADLVRFAIAKKLFDPAT